MKIDQADPVTMSMPPAAAEALRCYRNTRPDHEELRAALEDTLRSWVGRWGVDHAVVGVSGGIDSALVVNALHHAGLGVTGLLMPGEGTTGQARATRRGALVCDVAGVPFVGFDVSSVVDLIGRLDIAPAPDRGDAAWTRGQLVSNSRTPVLYHAATLLTASGHRTVVVGTMNRSEYELGYWGKANDGMVDLQPIANLWKSEVVALARNYGVPDEVINAPASGDTFDGRTDEEFFGTSYDAAELYLAVTTDSFSWQPPDSDTEAWWLGVSGCLERLTRYNEHKLGIGSPAYWLLDGISRRPDWHTMASQRYPRSAKP